VLSEFTILLPILLVIMMGLVDLGRVIYAHQIMTDLSREAAIFVGGRASASYEETIARIAARRCEDIAAFLSGLDGLPAHDHRCPPCRQCRRPRAQRPTGGGPASRKAANHEQ
jgi:hypothetical protein